MVKNFGRVKYFNISYIIMIGVPLLATIYQSLQNSWIKQHVDFDFPSGFKWMYTASISYATGIALYQFFCPKEIKRFDTSDEYVNVYQDLYERAYPDKKYNIVQSNIADSQEDTMNKIHHLNNVLKNVSLGVEERKIVQMEYDDLLNMIYPGCVQRFLFKDFEIKSKKNKAALWLSAAFYFGGTAILLKLIFCRAVLVFEI